MIKYLSFRSHIRTTYHPRSINFFFSSLFVFNQYLFSLYAHWLADCNIPFYLKERTNERENRLWLLQTSTFLFKHYCHLVTTHRYIFLLGHISFAFSFFFLLNICKTITVQEIDKQREETSSPIGGIKRERERKGEKEKERERKKNTID